MKYKLTNESKSIADHTLYRIKYLKHFSTVRKGEIGGWIESEKNLSQDGDCCVLDDAKVFGHARVSGNVDVRDNACLYERSRAYGNASIAGSSNIRGNACIYDNAYIHGSANISCNVRIYGDAQVYDYAVVRGKAWINGNSRVHGNARIRGEVIINGDHDITTDIASLPYSFGIPCKLSKKSKLKLSKKTTKEPKRPKIVNGIFSLDLRHE